MKHKHFIIIFLIIFLICVSFCIFIPVLKNGRFAEVYSDKELIQKIDLTHITEPYEFTVEHDGHSNTIYVEKGKISVIEADCPDKLCVKQGAISNSTSPIVCLPNKLTVKITGESQFEEIPDALSK